MLTRSVSPVDRWGTAKLKAAGFDSYDNHGHNLGEEAGGQHGGHGPEPIAASASATARNDPNSVALAVEPKLSNEDSESEPTFKRAEDLAHHAEHDHGVRGDAISQILGVAILEFGVIFVRSPPAQLRVVLR